MMRVTILAALLLGAIALAACGGGDSDGPAPTATVAVEPTAPPTRTPPPAETGVASIDNAIVAVEADDADVLVASMRFAQVECSTTPVPLYQVPPCDGQADGTLVDAFPIATCEGAYLTRAEAADGARQALDERVPATLYGIFQTAGTQVEDGFTDRAGAKYAVVFTYDAGANGTLAWALLLDDDGLVGILLGCAEDPEGFLATWRFDEPAP